MLAGKVEKWVVVEDLEEENLALEVGIVVKRKVALRPEEIGGEIVAPAAQSNNLVALDYIGRDVML